MSGLEVIIEGDCEVESREQTDLRFKFKTKNGGEGTLCAYVLKENPVTYNTQFELSYSSKSEWVYLKEPIVDTDFLIKGGSWGFCYYLGSGLTVGVDFEAGEENHFVIVIEREA